MGIIGIREGRLVQIEITVLKNCLDFKTYWMWEVIKKEVSKKTQVSSQNEKSCNTALGERQ